MFFEYANIISNLVAILPFYYATTIRARLAILFVASCSMISHSFEDGTTRVYQNQVWKFWNYCDVLGCLLLVGVMICQAYMISIWEIEIPILLCIATALASFMNFVSSRYLRYDSSSQQEYVIMHTAWHMCIYVLLVDWFHLLRL